MVLQKTLESPLDSKEIKPVNPKENQSWIFIGRTEAEAEVPILWPPDVKNWLTGRDPDAGKDWRQKEKQWQRMIWLYSVTDSMNMTLNKPQEIVEGRGAWHASVHRVSSSESVLHIRWPEYWNFSFSLSPSSEYSGLIFFRIDWFDLLAIQRTLKSLLQHHSLKASLLQCSASLWSNSQESACNAGDWVWSLGWEDPLKKGKATH